MTTRRLSTVTDLPTFDLTRYAIVIAGGVVLNLVALWIGDTAGATLEINAPESINAPTVAVFTAGIMIVAGAGYWFLTRKWPSITKWAPWAGFGFAIVTAVMPFAASPDATTATTLAAMHVITGLAWLGGTLQRTPPHGLA
jgi:hypothetical protein